MKQLAYTKITCLLLWSSSLLAACSDIEQIEPAPRQEGKVTLSVDVGVAPTTTGNDTDAGTTEENKIYTLYVFAYNQGTNSYCEAKRFNAYSLQETEQGKYHFEMEVTPGRKRFYLIANPQTDLRSDLTSYTQEELQNLKMTELQNHYDNEDRHIDDPIQQNLLTRGLPMSMSIMGNIELTDHPAGSKNTGTLTLDGGLTAFELTRAVAKVEIICRLNNEVKNTTLNLETLEILNANRTCYLLPKYKQENNLWVFDWPSMMEGTKLERTVGYEYGKQEFNDDEPEEWKEFPRGTHYLYENYFGKGLPSDPADGLSDETKTSKIHIVLSDMRDKTFNLTYLRRNHYLVVYLNIWAAKIECDIQPWTEEVIYPEYHE